MSLPMRKSAPWLSSECHVELFLTFIVNVCLMKEIGGKVGL